MSFPASFFRGSDACLLVMDITSEESFKSLNSWKMEFISNADVKDENEFPFALLVNKVDEDASRHTVNINAIKQWAESNGNITVYETSAKTGLNVEKAFIEIATEVLKTKKSVEIRSEAIDINSLTITEENKSEGGCC